MLSIGRLAAYVGVTPRAIRHYHALGLLPEPERTASGYRSYRAEDVIDLHRIKVLTDAGVPLARVRVLMDADPSVLRAAVAELDADLTTRIEELHRTRRSLAGLVRDEPFLPPEVAAMHARMRDLGVADRTLDLERDAWILVHTLYPDQLLPWVRSQDAMLDDPEYLDLYLLTEKAYDWAPDDPRIEEAARRTVAWALQIVQAQTANPVNWGHDHTAQRLITDFRRHTSPGWRRLMDRVEQLAGEAGLDGTPDTPGTESGSPRNPLGMEDGP